MLSNFYMGNSNCSCGKRLYSFTPPPECKITPYEGKRCKKCPYCFCAECLTDGVCKTCVLDTEKEAGVLVVF